MVKVVIDSTADMPEALRSEFDIRVVPLSIMFGNETFLDGVTISKAQFYERLGRDGIMPTTSMPAIGRFVEIYEQLAQETDAILSIHLSGKMSSTVQAARQAAAMVPQVRIEIIDSQHMSMCISYMALAAARAARENKSLDELVALVRDVGSRAFLYVGFDRLDHLERGGRIGHVRAFMGRLLHVRPVAEIREGELYPLEQVRTSKRMYARLVDLVQQQGPLEDLCVLCSTNCPTAEMLCERLAEPGNIAHEQILQVQVGGVIGTHVGPDSIGVVGIRQV
jgi:DegV family protein with EDD domain